MAWSFVQAANSTTTTVVFGSNVTVGNVLLITLRTSANTGGNTTISDTLGNTWVQSFDVSPNGTQGVWAFYVLSNKTTGANTVTIAGSNGNANAVIAEFSP